MGICAPRAKHGIVPKSLKENFSSGTDVIKINKSNLYHKATSTSSEVVWNQKKKKIGRKI